MLVFRALKYVLPILHDWWRQESRKFLEKKQNLEIFCYKKIERFWQDKIFLQIFFCNKIQIITKFYSKKKEHFVNGTCMILIRFFCHGEGGFSRKSLWKVPFFCFYFSIVIMGRNRPGKTLFIRHVRTD